MATAILRHETLSLRHPFPLGTRRNPNPNMIQPKSSDDFSRKRSPVRFKSNNRREPDSMVTKPPGKNLVMGQVKILKRGEPLIAATEKKDNDRGCSVRSKVEEEVDLSLGSTNRLGPDPETMQKQIKLKEIKIAGGVYAGSSLVSPPPSSVPVPCFLGRSARVCS